MSDNDAPKLFQQRRVRFLGEVVDTIFTSMPFFSAYSILSTTIIMYEITKGYIQNLLPWMNVLYFLLFLGLLFLPIMLVVYKYIIPSVWRFRSEQMGHLERKIDGLSAQIAELKGQKDIGGLELCREILDFAEHGDYSNGNVEFGTDEGTVRAGECLDNFRTRLTPKQKDKDANSSSQ